MGAYLCVAYTKLDSGKLFIDEQYWRNAKEMIRFARSNHKAGKPFMVYSYAEHTNTRTCVVDGRDHGMVR